VCIDYSQKKLNIKEAISNLKEIRDVIDEKHYNEVYRMLKRADNTDWYDDEPWEITGFGD